MGQDSAVEPHPLDEHRDPGSAALLRAFAAEVAANFGGDLARMRRANGYSNSTWVGDGLAVRIADHPGDMTGEVALLQALPYEVGHPHVLGAGTSERHGWLVTAQVIGQNLYEAWPTLAPVERRQAVHQLWTRAQAVHDATPSLAAFVASSGGYIPATPGGAVETARRVGAAVGLSHDLQARTVEVIDTYYRTAPNVAQVVNHGDLAFMNALWHRKVVALLDFEFAVLGPVEIDLCRLVLEAVVFDDAQSTDHEAGRAALEIAAQHMDPTHGRALLLGVAVLDQIRDLDITLAQKSAAGPTEDWPPRRLLVGLLNSKAGYLAPLLD